MNTATNYDYINNAFLNDLKTKEDAYRSSDYATPNGRDFSVGYCVEFLNLMKVTKLHQKVDIVRPFFSTFRQIHTFEGEIANAIIIGWKIRCTRSLRDEYGGYWRRVNQVLGTNHFKFIMTSCFMRDLNWEIDIYYLPY